MNPLYTSDINQKLVEVKSFDFKKNYDVPLAPLRDIKVLSPRFHPSRKGIASVEGQRKLLHDLASIELQATELGIRTLIEFKDRAPKKFLEELLGITVEESIHCGLCLQGLKDLGGYWGMFPCHIELWNVSQKEDTLLERILKVHRYLEGSGLDATFSLLNKLKSFPNTEVLQPIISKIAHDEITHVQFGSKWFKKLCNEKGVASFKECRRILFNSSTVIPKRNEKIIEEKRLEAGFSKEEIQVFKDFQSLN